ncbi:MAG: FUSC family membrane protein, partial [Panacibacter sp.]
LRMSHSATAPEVLLNSILVLAGGIWYMVIALLFYRLTPLRPAQRALGDCLHETAKFLRVKAGLFSTNTNLDDEYHRLVEQQVIVIEKQNMTRELLYKNRALFKESTTMGRKLVITFVNVVDLYEQIMANWYDFNSLREKFGSTGLLEKVAAIMKNAADELNDTGESIQSNSDYSRKYFPLEDMEKLRVEIDLLAKSNTQNFMLKKVLVNLRKLDGKMAELYAYFEARRPSGKRIRSEQEYSKFVSHQKITPAVFTSNFTLESAVFRHSMRMMITCGLGFAISKFISYGHHSYWILLTIVIILKPGFSLTKRRNFERFTGTLIGGLIGLLALAFIHNSNVLFLLMFFLMIGTYTFQRVRYIVMVIFMTPYILILFNFLGMGMLDVTGERLLDTAIGSGLAFLASYFLFPFWESRQLPGYMSEVLAANLVFVSKLTTVFSGRKIPSMEYKLARKEVFVSTANLASAFQRMQSEPKSKQLHASEIYEFVVLNNVLSSNIAALTSTLSASINMTGNKEVTNTLNRTENILKKSLMRFDKNFSEKRKFFIELGSAAGNAPVDKAVTEQLRFIQNVATDIGRITNKISQEIVR